MSAGGLAFAAGAGVATFLSPCALPLVPGYVGYYVAATERGHGRSAGVVVRGLAAALGALATLTVAGGLAVAVGRPATAGLSTLEPLVGVVLVGLGVVTLAGWEPARSVPLPRRRRDLTGFALFGAGYAGASVGCLLPVFLGVVVHALTLPPAAALASIGAYAAGVAGPLLLLTVAVGAGLDVTTGRLAGRAVALERLAGLVLVVAGIGQLVVAVRPAAVPAPL